MYLVTGISGNVGSQVVAQLLERGTEVRALVRDPGKATPWQGRIEVVTGDLEKPESLAVAAGGVEGIFLMNVGEKDTFRRLLNLIGVVTDGHDPVGLSHWRAARFEALRAGRPAADVDFLRCGLRVQC